MPPVYPIPEARLARYPSLAGRSVFITGGGSGIGAALVSAFVRQGSKVAFVDIDETASAALAARLNGEGGTVWWQRCDVRDVTALQAAIAAAVTALGDITVLVNNVANDDRHEFEKVTPDYWDDRIAINQRPAFFAIQAVLPSMRRAGGGSIINFGSISWQTKGPDYPVYATAKSSMNGLTRGLARLLGRDHIRINTVTPGWVMTERQLALWVKPESEAEIDRAQCLPGRVLPEDLARMVLFLASDDARMCTAQEYVVDAGWT
jgi:NAD(P)-dependent dehydrogenase (short-subunit alcohol dehydrogenase family)